MALGVWLFPGQPEFTMTSNGQLLRARGVPPSDCQPTCFTLSTWKTPSEHSHRQDNRWPELPAILHA